MARIALKWQGFAAMCAGGAATDAGGEATGAAFKAVRKNGGMYQWGTP